MKEITKEELLNAYKVMLHLRNNVKVSYSNNVTVVINELAKEIANRELNTL